MAIYHFSAKVISRANGSSAVASAAYRSAERLYDQRLGRAHDFTNKSGVVYSEVMLPDGAPERLGDRSTLWNEVESGEVRKDAQLSREVEFAIPRELNQQQGIDLARDFVQAEFVDRGMIAGLNVHRDMGAHGFAKPHAHVMLTMREVSGREVSGDGFGAKVRDWNKTELVQKWRERWAGHVNERLASLDIDARVDHRSLEAQGIDLEPQNKIGPAALRTELAGLGREQQWVQLIVQRLKSRIHVRHVREGHLLGPLIAKIVLTEWFVQMFSNLAEIWCLRMEALSLDRVERLDQLMPDGAEGFVICCAAVQDIGGLEIQFEAQPDQVMDRKRIGAVERRCGWVGVSFVGRLFHRGIVKQVPG
jgi:hypothetical protein